MHLIPAGRALPQWVSRACHWSYSLFLEHDDNPSIFLLPPGSRGGARIPAHIFERISALLPGQQLDELKLWTICIRLAFRDPTGYAQGVEPFVRQFAADTSRTIGFLESAADFEMLLDAVDSSVIFSTMPPMLEDDAPSKNRKLINDMYEAWYENNIAKFDEVYLSTTLMKITELHAAMIDLRNENWVSKIETTKPSLLPMDRFESHEGEKSLVCPTGHIGNTFWHLGETQHALEGVTSATTDIPALPWVSSSSMSRSAPDRLRFAMTTAILWYYAERSAAAGEGDHGAVAVFDNSAQGR